jgi:hypothetical protein
MTWNLFLDDERFPPEDGREWVIARNVPTALTVIISCGMPSYISFDHDLGEKELTGYDLAKILVDDALDFPDEPGHQFPADFSFYVHSQNPIGKANIEGLLNNYLEFRNDNSFIPL